MICLSSQRSYPIILSCLPLLLCSHFSSGQSQDSPIKIAVLVYPGVELLDFSGPVEVFSNVRDFQVYLVSTGDSLLTTKNHTLRFKPDYTITNAPQPDILVVPGAPLDPVVATYKNPAVLAWINKVHQHTQVSMSVCTGAFIISKAGLTRGKTITSHAAVIDSLSRFDRQTKVVRDTRFVEDGKLLTTAGISAGIDGALHVVDKLRGRDEALLVTRIMQYDKWQPEQGIIVGKTKLSLPRLPQKRVGKLKKASTLTDPVCHMQIMTRDTIQYTCKGRHYKFCSGSCRETFRRHPDQYVGE